LRDNEVRTLRRKLQRRLEELLRQAAAPETVERRAAAVDQPEESAGTAGQGNSGELMLSDSSRAAANAQSTQTREPSVTDGAAKEMEHASTSLDMVLRLDLSIADVVLGLLAEVLQEELPRSPAMHRTIIGKLRTRIEQVMQGGE
jgi:hypothetical protein